MWPAGHVSCWPSSLPTAPQVTAPSSGGGSCRCCSCSRYSKLIKWHILHFNIQSNNSGPGLFSSRSEAWMWAHRRACWLPLSIRQPKNFTAKRQRRLVNSPSGAPLAHTWKVWWRCSRPAPTSACLRKSCSTKASIGCCPPVAFQS